MPPSPLPTSTAFYSTVLTIHGVYNSLKHTYQAGPATFPSNGTLDPESTWFISASIASAGWSEDAAATVTLLHIGDGKKHDPIVINDGAKGCNPGTSCSGEQAACVTNWPISPQDLASLGGAFMLQTTVTGMASTSTNCANVKSKGGVVVVTYSIRGGRPHPTSAPTPGGSSSSLGLLSPQQSSSLGSSSASIFVAVAFAVLLSLFVVHLNQKRVEHNANKDVRLNELERQLTFHMPETDRLRLMEEKRYNELQYAVLPSQVKSLVESALIGASLVTEVVLIQLYFLSGSLSYLGWVAAGGRLVHPAASIVILANMGKGSSWGLHSKLSDLAKGPSKAISKIYSTVMVFSLFEVTMIRYLPWRDTSFSRTLGAGFPTPRVFKMALYCKLLHNAVTATCQAIFLTQAISVREAGLTSMPQSQVYLYMLTYLHRRNHTNPTNPSNRYL